MDEHKVCIIGAGSSGLVAAKILQERGVPFDCFELGSDIGGLWRYGNDNRMSAAYQSLHINSSRSEMAYSDFPMPHNYPDFPHHSQILSYFERYVEHFGLRDPITFRTRVNNVQQVRDGYRVTVSDDAGQRTSTYRSVIVANGHHWCPRHVEFPGQFNGQAYHSHDYRTPDSLVGKRVLVIGIGNSGCDIACESARVSRRTLLSTRRGAHIIPKYIFGKPLDRVCPPFFWTWLPFGLFQRIFGAALYLTRGRLGRYGLPTPDHKILEEHPTVSADLLNLMGHGRINIKPNVKDFDGDRVRFVDGSEELVDTVIYATGYQIRFPFLDPKIINTQANQVRLYRRVVHPTMAGLYFVGLVQPWGPMMPLAEAQSEWIADLIEGRAVLPSVAEMELGIVRQQQKTIRRYGDAARHTIQVDFYPYLAELKKERQLGRRHAAKSQRRGLQADVTRDADQEPRSRAA